MPAPTVKALISVSVNNTVRNPNLHTPATTCMIPENQSLMFNLLNYIKSNMEHSMRDTPKTQNPIQRLICQGHLMNYMRCITSL